jgi:glycosyltransferase involved in cell wall biosynthesis
MMSGRVNKLVIVVGSHSVHTHRFVTGLSHSLNQVVLITNQPVNIANNVDCHTVNFSLTNICAYRQIARIILAYVAPDCELVVHIHQANSYAYHTIRAIKKYHINAKIILTTWGSDVLVLPHKNWLFNKMVKYNLRNADIITSDSLYMSSKIIELMNNKPLTLHTINFGIQTLPELSNLSQKKDVILSNRLHKPLYRIDKIIKAFAQLIKVDKFANYTLVVAASGDETPMLKNLAHRLAIPSPAIIFTGMLSSAELRQWYQSSKLFVSIPTSDACSLSLLEAMSFGCIPILSNLPANLEWVIDDINGIIVENVDKLVNDFIRALEFNNQRVNELIRFNHQLISRKANASENLHKFIRLYFEV